MSEHDLYLTVIKAIRGNVEQLRLETTAHRAQIAELGKALYKLTSEMDKLAQLTQDVKDLTKTLAGSATEDGIVQKLRQVVKQDDDVRKELEELKKDLMTLKRSLLISAIAGGLTLAATQDITKWLHILKILL